MHVELYLNDKHELMMSTESRHNSEKHHWCLTHDVDVANEYGRLVGIVTNAIYSYHHALNENTPLFGADSKVVVVYKL